MARGSQRCCQGFSLGRSPPLAATQSSSPAPSSWVRTTIPSSTILLEIQSSYRTDDGSVDSVDAMDKAGLGEVKYPYHSLEDFLIAKMLTVDAEADDGWNARFPVKGREIEATVLFADITRFSSRTADLDPTETLAFVNHFFAWITAEALRGRPGIVDKYIGDEIMVVFSKEFGSADPFADAVQTARWMGQNDVFAFLPHVGIATGPVIVGYVGTPLRYNCSVFGAPGRSRRSMRWRQARLRWRLFLLHDFFGGRLGGSRFRRPLPAEEIQGTRRLDRRGTARLGPPSWPFGGFQESWADGRASGRQSSWLGSGSIGGGSCPGDSQTHRASRSAVAAAAGVGRSMASPYG